MTARAHSWEVDTVKGLAILGVLVIHSDLFAGTLFLDAFVNRAVPVLLVLFGVSSELWWTRHSQASWIDTAKEYWSARYTRLLPPVWAAAALWWVFTPIIGETQLPPWPWVFAHAVGFLPQLGTTWFVTLIVQLILLFPLLHLGLKHLGAALACGVTLLLMWWCYQHSFDIIDLMRAVLLDSAGVKGFFLFWYLWIFAPVRFFPLIAGMIWARRGLRVSHTLAIACAATYAIGWYVDLQVLTTPFARNALAATLDFPLTITVLAVVRLVGDRHITRALGFLGRVSWGIYLGHLVVHHLIAHRWHVAFGRAPETNVGYFVLLLAAGLAFVVAERFVRSMSARRAQRKLQMNDYFALAG